MNIWIDIVNPSDALFFNSLLNEINSENISITVRDRAETIDLLKIFEIRGKIIGRAYIGRFTKPLGVIYRTIQLFLNSGYFYYSLSFENGPCVTVSKLKRKKSILFCDNDLKFLQKKSFSQDFEMKIKSLADYIIIPDACYKTFKNHIKEEKLISYNGYKEDIYIADYNPDPEFLDKIPYNSFIVLRPEALGSFYVKEKRSIVPELLKTLCKQNINVIYLPREKEDISYVKGFDVYIPRTAFNGLDLCYYADAILTGSGTFAREAACMGTPSVSFFPSKILLSVDQQLIDKRNMFHSRNAEDIINYVNSHKNKKKKLKLDRCKKVKKEMIQKIQNILNEVI